MEAISILLLNINEAVSDYSRSSDRGPESIFPVTDCLSSFAKSFRPLFTSSLYRLL